MNNQHIGKYSTEEELAAAVESQSLVKPYIGLVEDTAVDYDSKTTSSQYLTAVYNITEAGEVILGSSALTNSFTTMSFDSGTTFVSAASAHTFEETGMTTVIFVCKNHTLAQNTFREVPNLVSLSIPSYIKTISKSCCYGTSALTSMTMTSSVKTISESAFNGCSLGAVSISSGVSRLENFTFRYNAFSEVVVPDSITYIGNQCFGSCTSLTDITLGTGLTSLGNKIFLDCPATELTYTGTKAQWKAISKSSTWKTSSSLLFAHCTDGDITL